MDGAEIPYVFAALMAVEFAYNAIRRTGHQTARDSAVSVMVMVPHVALATLLPVVWFVCYRALEPAIPWMLPDAWWTWPIGVVVMDFAAYWMHRYHHALNLTWGAHSVHHSSDELTVAGGGRGSMAEPLVNLLSGAYVLLIVPVFLGLPLEAAAFGWLIKGAWGFAVHTRNIRTLGPLEHVLATPSHHRVHHAINPTYLHRNYGFVFIVWDKWFGTFQPELREIAPIYGTVNPPASFHPIAVAFHELRTVWRYAAATRRWRDKLRIWYMPAGWRPADVAATPAGFARHVPPEPVGLYVVAGLQLAYLLVASAHLSATAAAHGVADNLGYLGFLVFSTAVSGEYFDRRRGYLAAECIRAAFAVALVMITSTWFGRAVDGFVVVGGCLAAANLIAAIAVEQSRRRHALLPDAQSADVPGRVLHVVGGADPEQGAAVCRPAVREVVAMESRADG